MSRRTTSAAVLVALLALFALFAGACSSSDSDAGTTTTRKAATDEGSTTTAADGQDTDTDTDTEDASAPVSDEEFDAQIGAFTDRITDAGADTCAVYTAVSSETEFPDPANPEQVKAAVGVYDVMFGAIAATAPPEFAAQAATIVAAGDELATQAEAEGYEPEWFLEAIETVFSGDEISTALDTYFQTAQSVCDGGSPTTVG
ncbi:hypothetical protein BH10ACT3_BH10ACT3_10410 [soil metagenome]